MLPGLNHNIRYRELLFHVQTEDSGVAQGELTTHVFIEGRVIASARTSYREEALALPAGASREAFVRTRMQDQHKRLMKALVAGEYDPKIPELAPAAPASPTPEPGAPTPTPDEAAPAPVEAVPPPVERAPPPVEAAPVEVASPPIEAPPVEAAPPPAPVESAPPSIEIAAPSSEIAPPPAPVETAPPAVEAAPLPIERALSPFEAAPPPGEITPPPVEAAPLPIERAPPPLQAAPPTATTTAADEELDFDVDVALELERGPIELESADLRPLDSGDVAPDAGDEPPEPETAPGAAPGPAAETPGPPIAARTEPLSAERGAAPPPRASRSAAERPAIDTSDLDLPLAASLEQTPGFAPLPARLERTPSQLGGPPEQFARGEVEASGAFARPPARDLRPRETGLASPPSTRPLGVEQTRPLPPPPTRPRPPAPPSRGEQTRPMPPPPGVIASEPAPASGESTRPVPAPEPRPAAAERTRRVPPPPPRPEAASTRTPPAAPDDPLPPPRPTRPARGALPPTAPTPMAAEKTRALPRPPPRRPDAPPPTSGPPPASPPGRSPIAPAVTEPSGLPAALRPTVPGRPAPSFDDVTRRDPGTPPRISTRPGAHDEELLALIDLFLESEQAGGRSSVFPPPPGERGSVFPEVPPVRTPPAPPAAPPPAAETPGLLVDLPTGPVESPPRSQIGRVPIGAPPREFARHDGPTPFLLPAGGRTAPGSEGSPRGGPLAAFEPAAPSAERPRWTMPPTPEAEGLRRLATARAGLDPAGPPIDEAPTQSMDASGDWSDQGPTTPLGPGDTWADMQPPSAGWPLADPRRAEPREAEPPGRDRVRTLLDPPRFAGEPEVMASFPALPRSLLGDLRDPVTEPEALGPDDSWNEPPPPGVIDLDGLAHHLDEAEPVTVPELADDEPGWGSVRGVRGPSVAVPLPDELDGPAPEPLPASAYMEAPDLALRSSPPAPSRRRRQDPRPSAVPSRHLGSSPPPPRRDEE